jgi:hypothetical protein
MSASLETRASPYPARKHRGLKMAASLVVLGVLGAGTVALSAGLDSAADERGASLERPAHAPGANGESRPT